MSNNQKGSAKNDNSSQVRRLELSFSAPPHLGDKVVHHATSETQKSGNCPGKISFHALSIISAVGQNSNRGERGKKIKWREISVHILSRCISSALHLLPTRSGKVVKSTPAISSLGLL
jgi:hypothetical protein